ncbi:hypothetical protein AN641_02015 [Candidatus Epulonipiscioides gigas]|nr:hypothetical protein AN641_02015 [Epulopiscium sp. SCG-C07WGA-EpuloA2]
MKTLVVYYSLQGNTKKVAEIIADELGADLLEIKPIKPYSVMSALTIGKAQIKKSAAPEIQNTNVELNKYHEIIIGTPVWWFTFAPPIRAFIRKHDLSRKPIKLFCTHAGNKGTALEDLKNFIGDKNIRSTKDFYTGQKTFRPIKKDAWSTIEANVRNWVKRK